MAPGSTAADKIAITAITPINSIRVKPARRSVGCVDCGCMGLLVRAGAKHVNERQEDRGGHQPGEANRQYDEPRFQNGKEGFNFSRH